MGDVMDLAGQVAFVTGASRGIGQEAAWELAARGASVVIMAKSTAAEPHRTFTGTLEETAAGIEARGAEVLMVRGDVSHDDDVDSAVAATLATFGRCDILVNNAAVSFLGAYNEITMKRWRILMEVNLLGPVMLTRGFLPGMRQRDHGRIVNVSSASGRFEVGANEDPVAAHFAAITCAYGSSKSALNRMTVGLSHELRGTGVAVNALEVEAATQPFRANFPAEADISVKELPEAPAQLIAWLATQPASLSGQILDQDDLLPRLRAEGAIRAKVDPT